MKMAQKKFVITTVIITVALMVVGSFFDLALSDAVYAPSTKFVWFFQAFGESMALLSCYAGAGCFLAGLSPQTGFKKLIGFIVTVIFLICGSWGLIEPYHFLSGNMKYVGMAIEVLLGILLLLYCFKKADRSNPALLLKIGFVMMAVGLLSTLVVNVIKGPWGRPRYRSIIITKNLEFRPWWVVGTDLRDEFYPRIPHDEFKSFPSGHSSGAACAFVLVLLSQVIPKLKERPLVIFAVLWTGCTMFSRIMRGAHFLTDVTVGFAITFFITVLLYFLFIGRKKMEDTE